VGRNIPILSIYGFLRGVGSSIFNTLFPLYLVTLGYQLSKIGEIASVSNFLIIFLVPFLGILSDYYGRKPFVVLTGYALAMGLFIVGLTPEYIFLVAAYTLIRFSFRGGQPVRGALIAESVSFKRLGAAVGIVTSSFFIARVFVPSLAGLMADTAGYPPTFLLGGFIVVIGATIFLVYGVETYQGRRDKLDLASVIRDLKPRKNFNWLYITTLIDRLGWSLWFPLLNAYIGKEFGLSATEVGFLNSLMFTVLLLTQYLMGRWIDKVGYFRGLILSEAIAALAGFTLGFTGSMYLLIAGMLITGMAMSLWIPSYNKAVSLNSEKEYRAVEFSKINTYRAIAAIPAPYIGGYLYDYVDPRLPFMISSVLFIITTAIFYYVWRRRCK